MKFLVISDLHAKNDVLDKMDAQFKEADAVLFAGDFAECFKPETGADALHNLCLTLHWRQARAGSPISSWREW